MRKKKTFTRAILVILCIMTIILMSSCAEALPIGENTELSEFFLTSVIENDYDTAYGLLKNSVSQADFESFWTTLRYISNGAKTYTSEQIGWQLKSTNGVAVRVSAYQVHFDNGKIILLRVTTQKDIEGIAGIYFSDCTDFVNRTDRFVPALKVVSTVFSILSVAFIVWMFVDCLRRRISRKPLWAILIWVGISLTFTVGDQIGFRFLIAIMLRTSSIVADPAIKSLIAEIAIPIGAILYFFLRKKFTVQETVPTDTVLENPSNDTAVSEEVTEAEDKAE